MNRLSRTLLSTLAAAAVLSAGGARLWAQGQTTTTTGTTTATDGTGKQVQTVTTTTTFSRGKKKKDEKAQQTKDTRKAVKREAKAELAAGQDAHLPDKQLYDKAMVEIKKGHYDVARLDLQTMLNTYPDSQYQMRAKLAVADSWYKEGGTAALTQAEAEYADFRVFFPNAPEAAEAQMRIGDIYFKQMDTPDRDFTKAIHAEEEYRRMLTDYPNAPKVLTDQAKQRLREVQEVLATREANIAGFYGSRENWAAAIARYQTVADTYPLYSHMDDVLIGLGDAYEAQARYVRARKDLPEGPKSKLERLYDDRAADTYKQVVLEHAAAPHVEDAKDRLAAMGLPIPEPTKDQLAASEALENSRQNYKFSDRVSLFLIRKPDTVSTARLGEPTLTDPKQTTAPMIVNQVQADFTRSFDTGGTTAGDHGPAPVKDAPAAPGTTAASTTPAPAPGTPATTTAPLAFEDVPAEGAGAGTAPAANLTAPKTTVPAADGNGMSVEILTPSAKGTAADTPGGLHAVGPANNTPLPPTEKAAEAPTQVNEAAGQKTPAAQEPPAKGKAKADYDKSEESSSKHKKKKGIKKIVEPL